MLKTMKIALWLSMVALLTLPEAVAGRPDVLRQTLEQDPVVVAVLEAFRQKHGGCPWLDGDPLPGAMVIMLEAEPYLYSKNTNSYSLQLANLEVHLNCFHALSADIYAMHDTERGYAPISKTLKRIEFSYDGFVTYIARATPRSATLRDLVLNDPVVLNLYGVMTEGKKDCQRLDGIEIELKDEEKSYPAYQRAPLSAREFSFSVTCTRRYATDSYQFTGEYFPEKAVLTWKEMWVSGSVE